MAKKAKKEAVKPDESKATLAKKKYHAEKAAKAAAKATRQGAAPAPVAAPAVKKPKKPRFVREKKAARPQTETVPLPPRSTTFSAKIMSKGLALPPKDDKSGPMPMR